MIQPIVVRKVEGGYEIVAGERRWRASQRAGLLKVPVVVRDIPDERLLAAALIENLQREDLNPIEEAQAYRRLADEFQYTQDQIAESVGKDRSSIANIVRLLRLPREIRENVPAGTLSMGHARAILALPDEQTQLRVSRDVVARQLSVRDTELLIRKATEPASRAVEQPKDVHTRAAEEKLRFALGTACGSCANAAAVASRSTSRRRRSCSGSDEQLTERRCDDQGETMKKLTDYSSCAG